MLDTPGTEFLALQEALLGRYSLEREIGRGGMGVVYLAHEVSLDRPVALKLLPPAFAVQPSLKERFLREARTAAKLSHPNIVPIHAVDEVDGFVFFAMAYIDGESLGDRIRSRGPLNGKEAARVLRDVAWALAYAHAEGVIHRDIKPDNILLERGSGRALVTDFGIAHVGKEPGLTGGGDVLGTAEFMSPEQASGESVGPGSDIYALGAVGFYATTGRLPFQGDTMAAVLAKHLTQPAPAMATVAPEVSSRLGQVIDRCLLKSPSDRFSDGAALAEAVGEGTGATQELPVPLRVFVNKIRGFGASSPMILVLWITVALVYPLIGVLLDPEDALSLYQLVLAYLFYLLTPMVPPWLYSRRLLKAGYGADDARLALQQDVDRRLEEIRFEFGKGLTWIDRVLRILTRSSFAIALGSVIAMLAGVPFETGIPIAGLATFVGTWSFFLGAMRNKRRRDTVGEGALAVLKSRLGDWLFKLGGVGLDRSALGGGPHRPTEMAIGLAADRLFEELPKTLRRELQALPETVRMLEADAQEMRRQMDGLTGVLGEIGEGAGQGGTQERERLRAEVEATRKEAESRMTEAVSAMEAIRLGLLRLHAGDGTISGITEDMGAARDIRADIERLLEGREEVERLLAGRDTSGGG
ncbi:serine/threonine-protein kinase [Gemmatimonadota bacterium]